MSMQVKMCPSAPWNSEGAQVFGVVGGEARAPKVLFLKELLPPSKELEAKLGGTAPEQVFRIAAPCAGSGCGHHDDVSKRCNLVGSLVQHVDQAYEDYAVCAIRSQCVWWDQEGVNACVRCPQIATKNFLPSEQVKFAAVPVKK